MRAIIAAAVVLAVLAMHAAHAVAAVRMVEIMPTSNITGFVELVVPTRMLGDFTGLFMSNTSNCSVKLDTWYASVGGETVILFNPGAVLVEGRVYRFYLCYGDLIYPPRGLGTVSGTGNATVSGSGVVVEASGDGPFNTTINASSAAVASSRSYSLGGAVWGRVAGGSLSLSGNVTPTVAIGGSSVTGVYAGSVVHRRSIYTSGYAYGDTGEVLLVKWGAPVNQTVAVTVYIRGWPAGATVSVQLLGDNGAVIAEDVAALGGSRWTRVDLEGSMYTRAVYIRIRPETQVYYLEYVVTGESSYTEYLYDLPAAERYGFSDTVAVSTPSPVAIYNGTITVEYYVPRVVTAQAVVNATVLYAEVLSYNVSSITVSSVHNVTLGDTLAVDGVYSGPGGAPARIIVSGLSAAAEASGGGFGYASSLPPASPHPVRITVVVRAGPPARYVVAWRAVAANASTSYRLLYISEPIPATNNTSSSTLVVPDSRTSLIASVTIVTGLLLASMFFIIRALRTNRLDYVLLSVVAGLGAAAVAMISRMYTAAEAISALTLLLAAYAIIERLVT